MVTKTARTKAARHMWLNSSLAVFAWVLTAADLWLVWLVLRRSVDPIILTRTA